VAGFAFGLQSRGMKVIHCWLRETALGFWKALLRLVNDTNPTLLGSQDGQRVGQAAQESTRCGKKMLHNIYLAETERKRKKPLISSWRVRSQAQQSDGMFGKGRRAAGFLRLPANTDASPSTNPNRVGLCDGSVATYRTKGSGSALACETNGVQVDAKRAKRWRALNGSELLPR